jgi:hypothetical protein
MRRRILRMYMGETIRFCLILGCCLLSVAAAINSVIEFFYYGRRPEAIFLLLLARTLWEVADKIAPRTS